MSVIVGIKLFNRVEKAVELQRILSKYGCSIRARLGLPAQKDSICSDEGIILLVIAKEDTEKIMVDLKEINDIKLSLLEI